MIKIIFMGTPEFSVPILEALISNYDVVAVVTQPDKCVGRHHELKASPVKECALKHNIKVFQPEKISTCYDELIALKPDLLVTAAYGQFIGEKLLKAPLYKSINVHGSLLPSYRGGSPIQTAILNGDKVTGITIMYMEKKMDAGDILAKQEVAITENMTSGELFNELSLVGRDLLLNTIPYIISGNIKQVPQDESLVSFAYNITKEQEVIDVLNSSVQIHNQVRAFNPSPIAHIVIKSLQGDFDSIKIYETRLSKLTTNKLPGTLVVIDNKLYLACGDKTLLELKMVQPSGRKPMSGSAFIQGALRKYMEV